MLLAAVVGSGIMADQLSAGNQAIALLANTIATGAALAVLILTFGESLKYRARGLLASMSPL
jgi:glycerol uptake facilitator-like aquaporin